LGRTEKLFSGKKSSCNGPEAVIFSPSDSVREEAVFVLKQVEIFIKKETVLCIAAVCAAATMLLVPPDGSYLAYIDLRVLCLLLCLMAVVVGLQECGIFRWLTWQLLSHSHSGRILSVTLVLLPFFSSMLVTNDVALLIFVPFTIALLSRMDCRGAVIPMLVLQTIAANLGSMATPVGNPQNLFIYAAYELSAAEFFSVTLPLTAVSLLALVLAAMPVLPKKLPAVELRAESIRSGRKLAVYAGLFALCLLTVFRVLPYGVLTVVVLAVMFALDRSLLREADYGLLATFVCFFIVSGNLGRVEAVNVFLRDLLGRSELLTAVGASQVISNVPAAVLLSGFTDHWQTLLEGVSIGGLGTPIASLASLITLKQYMRWSEAKTGRFMLVFLLANFAALTLLLAAAQAF